MRACYIHIYIYIVHGCSQSSSTKKMKRYVEREVSDTCGVCLCALCMYSPPVLIELVYEDDEAPRDVVVFKRQSWYLKNK